MIASSHGQFDEGCLPAPIAKESNAHELSVATASVCSEGR